MPSRFESKRLTLALPALVLSLSVMAQMPRNYTLAQSTAAPDPDEFTHRGIQPGEQLRNLPVYALDGTEEGLADVDRAGPMLLLTSSYTCPKSRSSYPRAEALAQKIGDRRLRVSIIYVLEAHPKGDPSPYRGFEDVTAENHRDGILCRQPRTLNERLGLAKKFKDRLNVKPPIYVDAMNDAVWRQLGDGPNMGVLVGSRGIVIMKQSWFDAASMEKAIETFLAAVPADQRNNDAQTPADQALDRQLTTDGLHEWDIRDAFSDADVNQARKLLIIYPALAKYMTPMSRGISNQTPLDFATEAGRAATIELLLSKGADVNAENRNAPSALHLASAKGDPAIVELLIRHGANVNLKAPAGPTPLDEAAIHDHRDVVDLLLNHGAKTTLFTDAAIGKLDATRKLLDDDPTRAIRPDGWSRTPMDYAAAGGQIEMARLLLSYGAKGGRRSGFTDTPLHWAARQKQAAMANFLLSVGEDPNATGEWGRTPLGIATAQDDIPTLDAILAHKPDLQALDMQGWAAFHVAAEIGALDVAQDLIRAGADFNVPTGADNRPCGLFGGEAPHETPLHIAAEWGQAQIVKLLLQNNAAVDARTSLGLTPLHVALGDSGVEQQKKGRGAIVALLVAAGADVNAKDKEARTPLDLAAKLDDPTLVKLLKDHGAHAGGPPKENIEN